MRLLAYAHNQEFPDIKSAILHHLGINEEKIQRLRGVYAPSKRRVIIHTRTGSANRIDYPNNHLMESAWYRRTSDDTYDITYADFIYEMPPRLLAYLNEAGYFLTKEK